MNSKDSEQMAVYHKLITQLSDLSDKELEFNNNIKKVKKEFAMKRSALIQKRDFLQFFKLSAYDCYLYNKHLI